jgi:hypothetical protein
METERNKWNDFIHIYLDQRWPTGGPRLDLLRPPPSQRFGSIGKSFNTYLILLAQSKI